MAEKISTLIVRVDLDCHKCYNKMRKILCNLQDQERITTISYDDKSKMIAIVGPFDPHRLACKIRCKGGKVVKDIHIVNGGGGGGGGDMPQPKLTEPPPSRMPEPAPMNKCKKKKKAPSPVPAAAPVAPPQPPAPTPEPAPEMPPSPPAQPPRPDWQVAPMEPAFVEEKQPKARPAELEPAPPPQQPPTPPKQKPVDCMPVYVPTPILKHRPPPAAMPEPPPAEYAAPTPTMVEIPSWPAAPVGPCGCPCCAPCYQGYYEGCRCYSCGRLYGYAVAGAPAPPAGCGYRGCRMFSDEDPTAACTIM